MRAKDMLNSAPKPEPGSAQQPAANGSEHAKMQTAASTTTAVPAGSADAEKAVSGGLRFVLPTRIGEVKSFADIPESDVLALLG